MSTETGSVYEIMCDHDVVFTMPPTDANALLQRLERIDRQAQNAVTGREPVNAQAVFIQLDEIKELLGRADHSGRFALMSSRHDGNRAREATAKLANTASTEE
jgi:hypothetical protein